MFGNNPFLTKKDPVLGAVQEAMQDGAVRRQAEALVNEEFGVYSRKAVVREQLAAYDARLEEAYKCMKEGQAPAMSMVDPKASAIASNAINQSKMNDIADKAVEKQAGPGAVSTIKSLREGKPNDGNLANNYPPFDKVTRGDVVAGRLGKDQMGGKKKMGEGLDIVNAKTGKNLDGSVQGSGDVTRTPPKEDPSTPKSYPGAASSLTPGNPTQQRMQNIVKETKLDEISDELKARFYKKSEKPRSVKMDGKTVGKIRFEPKEGGKVGQGEWIGRHRQAHNTGIEHGTPARHLAKQIVRDTEREHQSDMAWKKSLRKEETLDEAVSRKHFQQVADLIKGHESQEKRNELASHHASIFAKQNPRFNHEKFHAAAGSTAHQAPKKMEEAKKWIQAAIKKKMHEEDSSF